MKYKKIMLVIVIIGLSLLTKIVCAEEFSYTKDQLHSELEWSGRNCVKPSVPPPESIPISIPELNSKKAHPKEEKQKNKSWRRWIDFDGDGICEVFDVHQAETSMTGRFEGYPIGGFRFKDGKWIKMRSGGEWFPLILRDKKSQKIYHLYSPFYGLGGFKVNTMTEIDSFWGKPGFNDCNQFRESFALAYMLAFDPPQELKTDVLMSGDWTGDDYIFVVFPGLHALTEKAKTLACIKPYLKIAAEIDHRIRELYPTYFSGPYGLK